MLLLEHDGKELLRGYAIPVAPGVLISETGSVACDFAMLPEGPWVVKAQVPVGGRGKAGGIRMADTTNQIQAHLDALLGSRLKEHRVRGCRIESRIAQGHECYISLSVDAATGGVGILLSGSGGVEVESTGRDAILHGVAAPDVASVLDIGASLVQSLDPELGKPMLAALARLADAFFGLEALLVEVNPLFILPGGGWIAGDAKVILDDNCFDRQPGLVAMAHERAEAYPEAEFKLTEGFDYIELDPSGVVGMVTTGAGLSMMLVDQLADAGVSAFNFCDMRTGQMKGDPHRLTLVLRRMCAGSNISVLLVNVFAGITDLGEFARLLVAALGQVPELGGVPIVARLLGNGLEEAQATLRIAGLPVRVEPDLDKALERVLYLVGEARA